VAVGVCALIVIPVSTWLATRPRAEQVQTDLPLWITDPPQPIGALFAAVNALSFARCR
jgi:hypothetical protein